VKTRKEKADAPAELRKGQRKRLAHAKHTVRVCWRAMGLRLVALAVTRGKLESGK
jgi:hypothetical protein